MFCPHCGTRLADGSRFCPYCSKTISPIPPSPRPARPVQAPGPGDGSAGRPWNGPGGAPGGPYGPYDAPGGRPQSGLDGPDRGPVGPAGASGGPYSAPGGYPPGQQEPDPRNDPRGMKWYKFIIYFQLFANAVSNVLNAGASFTGLHYSDTDPVGAAARTYASYPALKVLDWSYGFACLALAVFAILVRSSLANFKRQGPRLYYLLLIANLVVGVLDYVLAGVISGVELSGALAGSSLALLGSGCATLIMLILTKIYFDHRKDLFKN
ncbi:MAG: zinc-ribbon domain-containing protein [Oscillospiraceae bacterium]|nr:zinc-ribbon domain-containing protein [Oscillospiraceae bacterium]